MIQPQACDKHVRCPMASLYGGVNNQLMFISLELTNGFYTRSLW